MTKSEMLMDIARKLDTLLDLKNSLDMGDSSNHGAYFAIVKQMDHYYAMLNTITFPDSGPDFRVNGIGYLQKN